MTDFNAELDQLTELKGGRKHMWLKQHKEIVLDFCEEFGEAQTRKTFCLTENTLQNLTTSKTKTQVSNQLSKADKAIARADIAEAGVYELRKEVRELRQLIESFQQSVGEQLVNKFFLPLLQAGLSVDHDLNLEKKHDPLRIDNIDFKQLATKTRKQIRKG
ncbi:hypothetical protein ACFLVJ_01840 [Chloroflexota bacterium]